MNDTNDTTELIKNGQPFMRSPDTIALVDRLKKANEDETLTYEELGELISRDVRKSGKGALLSARRIVEREKGFVFRAEPNVGLVRLNNSGKHESALNIQRGIGRVAHRAGKRMASVDYDGLTERQKREHNAGLSFVGAVALMSKTSSQKTLVEAADDSPLPTAETLRLFTK